MTIKRHSRIAAAAVIAPLAVLAVACGNDSGDNGDDAAADPTTTASSEPTTPASEPTTSEPADPSGIDYVLDGVWHQADGDDVDLPEGDYYEAAIWEDQLVTLQPWGEAYSKIDIFDDAGELVESIEDTNGIAVSADGAILTYVQGGDLIARWDGGQSVLAQDVTDTGGGESVGGAPISVIGSAPCEPESGACLVRVNTDFECKGVGSSDVPLPTDALRCFDEQDLLLSYTNEIRDNGVTCGGLWSADTATYLWQNCDYQAQDISPDAKYVVGAPSQYDGLGYREISILDAKTGQETGRYAPEGQDSFIWSGVAWTTKNTLLLSAYDGANWHLTELAPDGTITEIGDPVAGSDVDNPFLLIRH